MKKHYIKPNNYLLDIAPMSIAAASNGIDEEGRSLSTTNIEEGDISTAASREREDIWDF